MPSRHPGRSPAQSAGVSTFFGVDNLAGDFDVAISERWMEAVA
jgi:hypothetical protein